MSASSAPFSPDRVLGASLWRMTFLLVQGGGSVVLAASLGHILDARTFATTLLVQGVLVIAQTIGDFGLAQATVTILPAWIARSPESARRLLASASRAYLYAAGAAMVLTVVSAALVPEAARVPILVSAPAAAATVIVAGADGLLRSQGEFRRPVLFVAASEIGGFAGIPSRSRRNRLSGRAWRSQRVPWSGPQAHSLRCGLASAVAFRRGQSATDGRRLINRSVR